MKRLLITIILMAGVGMCMTSITYFNASSLTFAAEQYFRTVSVGKIKRSYDYLSADFKRNITLWDYKQYIDSSPLQEYKSVDWTFKRQDEATGLLRGTLKTQGGRVFDIELGFAHEQNRWKINAIVDRGIHVREELEGLKRAREHATVPTR